MFFRRCLAHCAPNRGPKVTVCGASGGIGQPLCLLLKQIPLIKELCLHDIRTAKGVALDLSHVNTEPKVTSFGEDIDAALKGSDVVVIPAGMPRKPGMTRDDLFSTNASICASIIDKVALNCPQAVICIVTNPVNSTVPIASEVLKHRGVFDANKLIGVTTLDIVRANTFVAELKGLAVKDVSVPVVAGHSGNSIVPLLSQTKPKCSFTEEEQNDLISRIQNAGTAVVEAKAGAGSATLAMAFAAERFVHSLLKAQSGQTDIVECAMTEHEGTKYPRFFSFPCLLGPNGVAKRFDIGKLSRHETALLDKAIVDLEKNIKKGTEFGIKFCQQLK